MTAFSRPLRRLFRRSDPEISASPETAPATTSDEPTITQDPAVAVEILESDPLLAYLQSASGPVDVSKLELDSPALQAMREAGIALVVPLVSQGELIGTLNLGPRLSDQEYSSDDRRLLATLAAQAAPAIRVAQLVQQQATEIQARERYDQEMRLATLIQQQFLPRTLPDLPDWQVAAYYGPARAVGGDFYDFIELADGRIGVVVGDVTDKGVPAALIMARTHSILRGEAPRLVSPGKVLERANELLVAEMPEKMFVTCLYAVIDPAAGRIVFANAGHNLPYVTSADGVIELRATGMPLGLLEGMTYDETEATIEPGQDILLYSDGLVEAHDPAGAMYGFPRLRERLVGAPSGSELLDVLLEDLHGFTGRGWEQEDDITLVTLRRSGGGDHLPEDTDDGKSTATEPPLLAFSVPGASGNERLAMDRVAEVVAPLGLPPARLERLKTAVSEATMNAIEYGSGGNADVPVEIEVVTTDADVVVRITDRAVSGPIPNAETPDLDLKLAGLQKARGWGLFLIREMVDAVDITPGETGQTVTLTMHLEGGDDGRPTHDQA